MFGRFLGHRKVMDNKPGPLPVLVTQLSRERSLQREGLGFTIDLLQRGLDMVDFILFKKRLPALRAYPCRNRFPCDVVPISIGAEWGLSSDHVAFAMIALHITSLL